MISTSDINSTIDRGVETHSMKQRPRTSELVPPSDTADMGIKDILRKPLNDYVVWLRDNRENLVRLCRVAEVRYIQRKRNLKL